MRRGRQRRCSISTFSQRELHGGEEERRSGGGEEERRSGGGEEDTSKVLLETVLAQETRTLGSETVGTPPPLLMLLHVCAPACTHPST